jgi:hypothetical protein
MKCLFIYKLTFFLTGLLLLSGCTNQSYLESTMTEYTTRLERVLEVNFTIENQIRTPFPSQVKLRVDVPGIEINLREFYAIKHCRLAALVAQRNSALGKAQLPSQRFLYEHKLLKAFDECAQDIAELKPELSAKLRAFEQQKQALFPLSWAKLIQQSQESYSAFKRKNGYIEPDKKNDYAQAIQDWRFLYEISHPTYSFPVPDVADEYLENTLKRIGNTRLPATLSASQDYFRHALEMMNKDLQTSLDTVQCKNGKASQKAEILRNVFVMFFVEELQPLGSLINQLHYDSQPVLANIAARLDSRELSVEIT